MSNTTTNNGAKASTNSDSNSNNNESSKAPGDAAANALKTSVVAGAHDVGEGIKHLAGDAVGFAKQNAESKVDAGKTRAVEGLESIATALRKTGEQLRAEKSEAFTSYIDTAAQKVDAASSYLKDTSFSDVLGDVKDFARREPALFLGGALVVGLLGGRFLKASRPEAATPAGNDMGQGRGQAQQQSQGNKSRSGNTQNQQSQNQGQRGFKSPNPYGGGQRANASGQGGEGNREGSSGPLPSSITNYGSSTAKSPTGGEVNTANKTSGAV